MEGVGDQLQLGGCGGALSARSTSSRMSRAPHGEIGIVAQQVSPRVCLPMPALLADLLSAQARGEMADIAVLAMDGKAPEHLGVLVLGEHVSSLRCRSSFIASRGACAGRYRLPQDPGFLACAIDTKHMLALLGAKRGVSSRPNRTARSPEGWPMRSCLSDNKRSSTSHGVLDEK